MKQKEKSEFLVMLLGTLGATLLGHALASKPKILGQGVIRWRSYSRWWRNKRRFLMPLHPFTNFEIQNYQQIEPKFNGAL